MANAEAQDSGLASLTLLLRFYGAAVDAQQISIVLIMRRLKLLGSFVAQMATA